MTPFKFELPIFQDQRGYFMQTFDLTVEQKTEQKFCQDNRSFSKKGVFRGLHYQFDPKMGKLVSCPFGKIVDFAYCLKTGQVYEFYLEKPNEFVYIPVDYAHGFLALEDSIVEYKCTAFYNKDGEAGISYEKIVDRLQKHCNIGEIIISERDKNFK